MEKVIFSKFSNERKSKYGIITKIVETEDRRRVIKEAASKEAIKHIEKIEQNMTKLSQYYRDKNLVIVPCHRLDDKTVAFEYVQAKRYDDVIEKLICEEDYEELEKELKKLKAVIMNVEKLMDFEPSDKFSQVFGENDYTILKGKKAFLVSNIDMIFENLFIDEEKLFVTDYEWVFDFEVPVEYVLFRSILLCSAISKLDKIKKEKLYACLEMKMEEIELYKHMEAAFQRFVSGENLFEEYKKSAKNRIFQLQYAEELLRDKYIDTYYELSDSRKIFVQREQYMGTDVGLEHKIKKTAGKVIFHLGSIGALIKVKEVSAVCNGRLIKDICIETNADLIIENDYYFKDKNPCFEIINRGYEKLYLSISIIYENTGLIGVYTDKIIQSSDIENKLREFEQQLILKNGDIKFCNEMIEAQDKLIQELRQKLQKIENSFVWKIYKKMKGVKEK